MSTHNCTRECFQGDGCYDENDYVGDGGEGDVDDATVLANLAARVATLEENQRKLKTTAEQVVKACPECHGTGLKAVSISPSIHANCLRCHPLRALLAVLP